MLVLAPELNRFLGLVRATAQGQHPWHNLDLLPLMLVGWRPVHVESKAYLRPVNLQGPGIVVVEAVSQLSQDAF